MIWSLDSSTDYEAAREAINHLLAIRVAERAREEAKTMPDGQRFQQLGQTLCGSGMNAAF